MDFEDILIGIFAILNGFFYEIWFKFPLLDSEWKASKNLINGFLRTGEIMNHQFQVAGLSETDNILLAGLLKLGSKKVTDQ